MKRIEEPNSSASTRNVSNKIIKVGSAYKKYANSNISIRNRYPGRDWITTDDGKPGIVAHEDIIM